MNRGRMLLSVAVVVAILLCSAVILAIPRSSGVLDDLNGGSDNKSGLPSNQPQNQGQGIAAGDQSSSAALSGVPTNGAASAEPTTIEVEKSAQGLWQQVTNFEWSLKKSVKDPTTGEVITDSVVIPPGEEKAFLYEIEAERSVSSQWEQAGAQGSISVTNTGGAATQGLSIVDVVQISYDGATWSDYSYSCVDISGKQVLQPGEEHSYLYTTYFQPVEGAHYRNVALVTICNYVDHLGEPWGTNAADQGSVAKFSLPSQPTVEETDETANLNDTIVCPQGFSFEASEQGPWKLSDSSTITFTVVVKNVNALSEGSSVLSNIARLVTDDCKIEKTASATVCICSQELTGETTIRAAKDTTPFWNQVLDYDWTVSKKADPDQVELAAGESQKIAYNLSVTRSENSTTDAYGVTGSIIVVNSGEAPTQGLVIEDVIQYWNGADWVNLTTVPVDLSAMPTLMPGETYQYAYSSEFVPPTKSPNVWETSYRNLATISIANFEGFMDEQHSIEASAEFSLPNQPQTTELDASANLTDMFDSYPVGFNLSGGVVGPWLLNSSVLEKNQANVSFNLTVKNDDAACSHAYYLNNTAILTESDSKTQRNSSESVAIDVPACPSSPSCGGCTYTIGYWKNHAGMGKGNQEDLVSQLLPLTLGTGSGKSVQVTTAQQAYDILSIPDASNGIDKLSAQLLGAKLNIANGACSKEVGGTIDAADSFLAVHNSGDWGSLDKDIQQQVLDWMSTLDDYNNGKIGPGHCSDQAVSA